MNTSQDYSSWVTGLLSDVTVQVVLGVLTLLAVCTIAYYLLARLRDSNTEDSHVAEMLRKNFEEMRSGGDIDEREFRNITVLLSSSAKDAKSAMPKPKSPLTEEATENDADSDK